MKLPLSTLLLAACSAGLATTAIAAPLGGRVVASAGPLNDILALP